MSGLPEYSRVPKETDPFTKTDRLSVESERESEREENRPSDTRDGSSTSGPRHTVTYVYNPSWPIKGSRQVVLAPLGRDIREALVIAREAFEELSEYGDERIAFHATIGPNESPVRVMDSVWQELIEKKPTYLTVHVKDGPGDQAARDRQETITGFSICGCVVLTLLLFIFFIWAMNRIA